MPRCLAGLVLFAVGIALTVRSELGLGPWDVFHQGVAHRLGTQIGTVAIGVGVVVLLAWIPLRQRLGIGTVLNTVLVGLALNLVLDAMSVQHGLVQRSAALIGGLVLMGLGTGLYIGSGLGAGPRDGVMMGLAARGWPVARARTTIELSALALGWLLGGKVGVGTVLGGLAIGPIVHVSLRWFMLPPVAVAIGGEATDGV